MHIRFHNWYIYRATQYLVINGLSDKLLVMKKTNANHNPGIADVLRIVTLAAMTMAIVLSVAN